MRPQRGSTKKAEGVSQGGLRSHSDDHLASTSSPGFSVQALGGMDRRAHPAKQRAEVRGPLDVVSAGHREGPSLIWCHKKAKAALPVLPGLCAGLQGCSSPQTDRTLRKPASVKETSQIHCLPLPARAANTWSRFQSGAQTINRCGFLSLSAGSA